MRILMLTQWFDPEPFFKGLPFAEELVKRGHEVEVLTGFPNYPGGTVYDGYRIKPWQVEENGGVRINRVALYPSHDRSGLRRMVNYLSFAISSLCVGPWLVRKPDVVYVYNLITLAWTAVFLRRLYGCKIVYDVQDLWPESVSSSGMLGRPLLVRLLECWSNWSYRCADRIVVLSPGFKRNLQERGIPEQKIEVIYNWSPDAELTSNEKKIDDLVANLNLNNTFNIMFAGTMGVMQALDTVLDAADLCLQRHPSVRFVLIGGGIEKQRLQGRVQSQGLTNVLFIDRLPMSEVVRLFDYAGALLVHLKENPLFEITIPSKTQTYLAVGHPILIAVKGDAAALVENAKAGYRCLPENPESLVEGVGKLLKLTPCQRKAMGENGKRFYDAELSMSSGVSKFESVFELIFQKKTEKRFSLSKLILDYFLTLVGLVLIAPLVVLLAIAVKLSFGSPVLFRQVRPGLYGNPFTMYKFRTMTDAKDDAGRLRPDADRLTPFGRFLRSSSLDELPELFNVLKGDMSLVGPRPLLMEYLPLYSQDQARRHDVRPGITGWAQVNGRNAISWEEKFELDVWYVDNRSFWLDIRILWMTVARVFKREGISQEGQATMERFKGNKH
ncbi:MAG: sugar transferase [Desulfuromonadales bacterium]|nr:sugar transferase [Desulfuromonadales bacterium]